MTDYDLDEEHAESYASELPYHYSMLVDEARMQPLRAAIDACCRDRIVLESGTGTGILSLLAARAGARRVYATEVDSEVATVARRNFERSGFQQITFLEKDSIELTPEDLNGDLAEVIIAENLSTWQVTEPQILIMNHFNRQLAAPGAVRLPQRVFNNLELGQATYRFDDLVELRTFYHEYSGMPECPLFSDPVCFHELDLSTEQPEAFDHTVSVAAKKSGTVNCLRLTSPVQVYKSFSFAQSNSLMPPVVVPLPEEIRISKGEILEVRIQYRVCTGWEDVKVMAAKGKI